MTQTPKEKELKLKENTIDVKGVILGLIFGVIFGLITGLIYGLIFGLIVGLIFGLIVGLFFGLIVGLFYGLTVGLTITFITQLIALITQHPEFIMTGLIVNGILIVFVQVIAWTLLKRLEAKKQ